MNGFTPISIPSNPESLNRINSIRVAALGWGASLTVSFCPALILSPIGYEPLEDSLDGGWIIAAYACR
jgi:hypothetical protein